MIVPTVLDGGSLPSYARPGDAGADLTITEACVLAPGERRLVGTGVRVAIPVMTEATKSIWSPAQISVCPASKRR